MATNDFTFCNHGSICLLSPNNAGAAAWLEEREPADALRWFDALVLEPRYVERWLHGLLDDGLSVGEV